ncbi:C40 family peptidase [Clostridium rectalis]|uniref:C40 family peptidase n=1 Tax=Clostridium rectalis TaxID=2040295 RepID=UPI000F63189F|nr:C40 family peptidase [Clostridium rectalis]
MQLSKQIKLILCMLVLFLMALIIFKTNSVKADAGIKINETKIASIKTANVKINKVIVVNRESTSFNTENNIDKNNISVSRGGSGRGDIVSYSYKFLGRPYVWGAAGPSSFDCSGFTAYVYSAYGVALDHYTGSQYEVGQAVSKENLVPGDLVFFNTYSSVSHVGIYIGSGQFIHASSGSGKVTISNLSGSYYVERYAGAKRVLK